MIYLFDNPTWKFKNGHIQYERIGESIELSKVNLPPKNKNFDFQVVNLDLILAIRDSQSYLMGLLPKLREFLSHS